MAFAVGNAVIRLVWMLPWVAKRRIVGVPWWRPIAFSGLPAALWLVSAVVPPPARYVLWAVAIAVEVALLASLGGQATWLQRSLDVDHLLERVSLLVVIVFGESILATIAELAVHWTLASGVTAVLAFLANRCSPGCSSATRPARRKRACVCSSRPAASGRCETRSCTCRSS
jgi:low temperature requirement protein LtrA